MPNAKTVVITAAGKGSRLGMNLPKCLVDLEGIPLITRQLEMLDAFDDVRVVVGFKAQEVIDEVLKHRKDVVFVLNHDFATTSTLTSLYMGAQRGREIIISLDGDLLVHKDDFVDFTDSNDEHLGVCHPSTDEPVYVQIEDSLATGFSRTQGQMEWSGLLQIRREKLENLNTYIYEQVEKHLPLPTKTIRCCEIDTLNDLERAREWVKKYSQ